jgi:hypothetical protein
MTNIFPYSNISPTIMKYFPALATIGYLTGLCFLVFHWPWWLNFAFTIINIIVSRFGGSDFGQLSRLVKKALPFVIAVFLVSTLFSSGQDSFYQFSLLGKTFTPTWSGLIAGWRAVTGYLVLLTGASIFQIKQVKHSFLSLSKRLTWLLPLYLSLIYVGKTPPSKQKISWRQFNLSQILNQKITASSKQLQALVARQGLPPVPQRLIFISIIVSLLISFRLIRILPGIPFAPGHRLLIILPLLFFISSTHHRWTATITTLTFGLLSLFLGILGNLGIIEIFRLLFLGMLVDLFSYFIPQPKFLRISYLIISGAFIGLLFTWSGVIWWIWMRVPVQIYFFTAHRFIFGLVFGVMSATLTYQILPITADSDKIQPKQGHSDVK